MKTIFDTNGCAKEIMKILEKYEATPYYTDEVFKAVKEEIDLTTPVRAEYATFKGFEEKENAADDGKLKKECAFSSDQIARPSESP